jgi:hypothetical protein
MRQELTGLETRRQQDDKPIKMAIKKEDGGAPRPTNRGH